MTGTGIAGLAMTGMATADPGGGPGNGHGPGGNDECGDCGTLLAKWNWDEDAGAFVFEKGRESLAIDADTFALGPVLDDEGEPTAVDIVSSAVNQAGDRVYEASCASVKAGPDDERTEFGRYASSFAVESPNGKAISNVVLCANHAFWQADLGTGVIDDPPVYGNQSDASLIRGITYGRFGSLGDPGFPATDTKIFNRDNRVRNVNQTIATDGDGTPTGITMTFDVTDDGTRVHLGSWEQPGPWRFADIGYSVRFDYVDDVFDAGTHTLAVDLPTA